MGEEKLGLINKLNTRMTYPKSYPINVNMSPPSDFFKRARFSLTLACEQALCLGKNSEEREGKGGFSLSPPRSTKGLFTGYPDSY